MRYFASKALLFVSSLMAFATFGVTSASAQATRTWISGVGDDVNPCSRTAPCKTFAGAISKTAAGGEINCLDPGGFGAVTIIKSITLDCTNTLGGVLASSTNGIVINGANVVVVIRGLTINGGPPTSPGNNGIRFLQGSSLVVQDSIIENFGAPFPNGYGIKVEVGTSASLNIGNTVITGNGSGADGGGILIQPTGAAGSVRATLVNTQILGNNGDGLRIDTAGNTGPGVGVTIDNSQIVGSSRGVAISALSGASAGAILLSNSTVSNNSTAGVLTNGPNAIVRVNNSTVIGNGIGISVNGSSTIGTFGNNRVYGNSDNGAFNLSLSPL
ncbi:MAG: right-handed parallel beta-helix repeat-containing protein [Pseudomonadota bacterium]